MWLFHLARMNCKSLLLSCQLSKEAPAITWSWLYISSVSGTRYWLSVSLKNIYCQFNLSDSVYRLMLVTFIAFARTSISISNILNQFYDLMNQHPAEEYLNKFMFQNLSRTFRQMLQRSVRSRIFNQTPTSAAEGKGLSSQSQDCKIQSWSTPGSILIRKE